MSSQDNPDVSGKAPLNLALVGKINVDFVARGEAQQSAAGKFTAGGGSYLTLGGAAGNVAKALKKLGGVFEQPVAGDLVTRIGRRPGKEQMPYEEYILSKVADEALDALLRHYDIRPIDVDANTVSVMPVNDVREYQDQGTRSIWKQKPSIKDKFDPAAQGVSEKVTPIVDSSIRGAQIVFADPGQPYLAEIAVESAKRQKVPVVVDYGLKEWPSNPRDAQRMTAILRGADYLFVPEDAVVQGMNGYDPDRLFETLKNVYRVPTIIMSDTDKPVRVLHEGKESAIEIEKFEGPKHANAAGDTRDAAFMFFLARGDNPLDAVKKATVIATLKVRYGDQWSAKVLDHVRDNPLFERDLLMLQNAAPKGLPLQPDVSSPDLRAG